mmetsp:Transcript_120357/g.302484  ORF Transcript_120357/g.302484 Transcript_120357/m.302484 type:complete len:102 (+) Transcript_120357:157-462(+)
MWWATWLKLDWRILHVPLRMSFDARVFKSGVSAPMKVLPKGANRDSMKVGMPRRCSAGDLHAVCHWRESGDADVQQIDPLLQSHACTDGGGGSGNGGPERA